MKTLLLDQLHRIETTSTKKRIVIVEAAVLLDANWDSNNNDGHDDNDKELFDAVWVVRSSSHVSADRLVSNRGMDREDALKRLEAQLKRRGIGNLDQEILNGSVTAVIQNDGDSSGDGDGTELWDTIQNCLNNSMSWKDGRCPKELFDRLPDFKKI